MEISATKENIIITGNNDEIKSALNALASGFNTFGLAFAFFGKNRPELVSHYSRLSDQVNEELYKLSKD